LTKIAFIGLGNMGGPMARNLVKAGLQVTGFDPSDAAQRELKKAGGSVARSVAEAAEGAFIVITALPTAKHVRGVCLGEAGGKGAFDAAPKGALFIDCSTVDVETSRELAAEAEARGLRMVDSPMSGGVGGAKAGTLTFMVGGSERDFGLAKPVLEVMGSRALHAGASGAGAAAKICNNLMLGIEMIAVAEGFALAAKLGLDAQKLYEIASTSTARCWALNDYCPAPGPVATAPSNKNYEAGFASSLMLKDLRLAMDAVKSSGATAPLGEIATKMYKFMDEQGAGKLDFSSIFLLLKK
jgi:3-hydroxyisobutyrate dehydrogenase